MENSNVSLKSACVISTNRFKKEVTLRLRWTQIGFDYPVSQPSVHGNFHFWALINSLVLWLFSSIIVAKVTVSLCQFKVCVLSSLLFSGTNGGYFLLGWQWKSMFIMRMVFGISFPSFSIRKKWSLVISGKTVADGVCISTVWYGYDCYLVLPECFLVS